MEMLDRFASFLFISILWVKPKLLKNLSISIVLLQPFEVISFQPLTIITKRSILDVATVLYPPLVNIHIKKQKKNFG